MIKQWSFSRYADYKKCPALAMYKHVRRMKTAPNKAMQRGSDIHKMAEDYALGSISKMPTELKLFADEFKQLRREKDKSIEEQWAFSNKWCATGWFDPDCWVRIKLDAAYVNRDHNVLVVIDHKTGSMREERKAEYMEQLELYGVAGLVKFPDVRAVSPRLWYLDHGVVHPDPETDELEFTQKDKPRLIKLWDTRVKPMLTDTTFKPKPNYGCQWCDFSNSKGGPCKH